MSLQFNFSVQEVKYHFNCELICLSIHLKFCLELTEHFGLITIFLVKITVF